MARYDHKETTDSGISIYEVRIEKPRPMIRTGRGVLVRRAPSRGPSIEVVGADDLRRIVHGE